MIIGSGPAAPVFEQARIETWLIWHFELEIEEPLGCVFNPKREGFVKHLSENLEDKEVGLVGDMYREECVAETCMEEEEEETESFIQT